MARLSDLAAGKGSPPRLTSFPGTDAGRRLWDTVFGASATTKEEGGSGRLHAARSTTQSWGNSTVSSDSAIKRLIGAMRSRAPGGWSDDRWEQSKHMVGLAYIAIHRIAMQWQQSEFQVFRKDRQHQDGKRPVTPDDPPEGDRLVQPYKLVDLLEKPNWKDSWGKWMYRSCQQKYITGTGLTWMLPNQLGVPMELYCIPTALAIPQPVVNPAYPDGYYRIQPVYPYGPFSSYPTPNTAVGAAIPAQWMLQFQFPHPLLWYDGYSPLTAVRLHLDAVEMVDRSRFYKMKGSINPSAVLNMGDIPGAEALPWEEIERIRAEWENEFQGAENHGRLVVSTPGANLEEFGTSPKDMDYSQGWEQLTSFALAAFGITKPAAGMVEDSSYATLFATLKQLHVQTVQPDCDDVASDLTRRLAPFFGDDLIVEIRAKRIDDHEITFSKIDKIAAMRGLPPSAISMMLRLLDLPVSEMFITEMSQAAPEQGGEGAPGAPGIPEGVGGATASLLGAQAAGEVPDEIKAEPNEVAQSRPKTGSLGEGSKGPQKHLTNGHAKVLAGGRRCT